MEGQIDGVPLVVGLLVHQLYILRARVHALCREAVNVAVGVVAAVDRRVVRAAAVCPVVVADTAARAVENGDLFSFQTL